MIDYKYIDNAINELISIVGIKENVDSVGMVRMLHANETKKCIKTIASQLGLPIEINLSFGDKFQSSGLTKTDLSIQGWKPLPLR